MNHPRAQRSFFVAAVVAGLTVSAHAFVAPESKTTGKVFVGYLYGHPRHINLRLYTHLCHAFLVADEEGNVRKDRNVPSRDLTTRAHQAGVKVLLSLGGWGWDSQF